MSPEMPSQFQVITANRLETLANALSDVVIDHPDRTAADPFQPETIVVQSKGMQDWLSMILAERNRICANTNFPFPNAFIEQLYNQVIGPLPESKYFDLSIMTFHILELMPELISLKPFERIRNYLSNETFTAKAFHLSQKIADLFDQYLVFRPDYIFAWESGQISHADETQNWQAILWKRIREKSTIQHRADIQRVLTSRLADGPINALKLPPRVSVFGISHLPPFHLQVIASLANRIPVYLFLLNPCKHYWYDILSEQQISRVRAFHSSDADHDQDLHLEQGNRLLASWGQQGKHFIHSIHQIEGQIHEIFDEGPCRTLLHHIQDDILNLIDRPAQATELPINGDNSVQIHVCHSPMREVEVLYDQLLEMLNCDHELEPRDILVMTPDIATYAPLVHAVFGTPYDKKTTIPYSVADQNIPKESQMVEGFLRLLDFHRSRFEVTRVIQLLEFPAIRRQFGISDSDIGLIEQWVRDVNIRWGWNGKARSQHGLPRFESNTWRQGIDRLLFGYAMMGDGKSLINGRLPHAGIDVNDSLILGNFVHFAESLHHASQKLMAQHSMATWHGILSSLIEAFIKPDEQTGRDLQLLRGTVEALRQISIWAPSDSNIEFEVVRDFITNMLERSNFGTGFLAGGVTFCAMLPMRSIPAKVICLLGMGHDYFPQEVREPTFNLIAANPRAGDRSKRNDDKYLFLEALISTRRIFYASYVGRDIQDNTAIPPSVVINELIEYAKEGFGIGVDQLVTEHPLQAFSKSYFDNSHPRRYSYSQENLSASQFLDRTAREKPFFIHPLPPPNEKRRRCDLSQLTAFFSNPSRFLLEQRMGISLHDSDESLEDREIFNLTALDRYHSAQAMLQSAMDKHNMMDTYQILKASGNLPHGAPGKICHQQLRREIDEFMQVLAAHTPEQAPVTAPVILNIQPFVINTDLDGIYPDGRILHRMAKARPRDLLNAFIGHLVMISAAVGDNQLPQTSLLICKDVIWQFGSVPDAKAVLNDYLKLYWEGLQYPLNFFANTSYAYVDSLLNRKMSQQKSLAAALRKWQAGDFSPAAESQDPYINLCFRGLDALTEDFEKNSVRVFKPLLSAGRSLKSEMPIDAFNSRPSVN
jgi:exodeoxyribonuclease V gamma subunit